MIVGVEMATLRLILLQLCLMQLAQIVWAAEYGQSDSSASLPRRIESASWFVARIWKPTNIAKQGLSLPTIIGLPRRELKQLMEQCPPIAPAELHGAWRGLSQGAMVAMSGNTQFIKSFCTSCNCPHGDNVKIEQQPPECWFSADAWQLQSGKLQRHGNYRVNLPNGLTPVPHATELNYLQAKNPKGYRGKRIVDKLVKLDDDLVLGLACIQFGSKRIPMSYFVMERIR